MVFIPQVSPYCGAFNENVTHRHRDLNTCSLGDGADRVVLEAVGDEDFI